KQSNSDNPFAIRTPAPAGRSRSHNRAANRSFVPAAARLVTSATPMRRVKLLWLLGAGCALAAGCGGSAQLIKVPEQGIPSSTPKAAEKIGFPAVATKNTTRVAGGDP